MKQKSFMHLLCIGSAYSHYSVIVSLTDVNDALEAIKINVEPKYVQK